ncbi:hypothetical protein Y032_0193g1395 [Ancylostoma ceylanicum]|uniref:Uncharacterized protein n=1 Tax=Ancylostoma ceylanicum TaxID=53326 RepID=A0A016SQ68_9BILA|nr:hypothetical protein Y032_0193g1395 [Ancylostoma ceylanicum]
MSRGKSQLLLIICGAIVILYTFAHMKTSPPSGTALQDKLTGDECLCRYKNVSYDFCYHLPQNRSINGRRFNCNFAPYLDSLDLLQSEQLIDLSDEDLPTPAFVTAMSENHYYEGLTLIAYMRKLWPRQKLIVYDLGLSSNSAENLKGKCFVEVREFPFNKYPPYVKRLLEYRWKPILIASGSQEFDYSTLPCKELIETILQKNTDPEIEKIALALKSKLPQEVADAVDSEKRERSIVICGLPECGMDRPLLERQKNLEEKVAGILDVLKVDCLPEVVFRMGTYNETRPRLVKVVLPSRSHWLKALANAHALRRTDYRNVYVRKSMTAAERARDYELRQQARERNQDMKIQMFADDIKIYLSYTENEQAIAHEAISRAINKMLCWSKEWELPLNLSKTVAMHFGATPEMPYRCGETTIQFQNQIVLKEFGAVWYMDTSVRWIKDSRNVVYKELTCRRRADSNLSSLQNTTLPSSKRCVKSAFMLHHPSSHSIFATTNRGMYAFFPTNIEAIKKRESMSHDANFAFIVRTSDGLEILKWYVMCALEEDCMAPPGSRLWCKFTRDRFNDYANCHRYDQAAINLLLANSHEYNFKNYVSSIGNGILIKREPDPGITEKDLLCSKGS